MNSCPRNFFAEQPEPFVLSPAADLAAAHATTTMTLSSRSVIFFLAVIYFGSCATCTAFAPLRATPPQHRSLRATPPPRRSLRRSQEPRSHPRRSLSRTYSSGQNGELHDDDDNDEEPPLEKTSISSEERSTRSFSEEFGAPLLALSVLTTIAYDALSGSTLNPLTPSLVLIYFAMNTVLELLARAWFRHSQSSA